MIHIYMFGKGERPVKLGEKGERGERWAKYEREGLNAYCICCIELYNEYKIDITSFYLLILVYQNILYLVTCLEKKKKVNEIKRGGRKAGKVWRREDKHILGGGGWCEREGNEKRDN